MNRRVRHGHFGAIALVPGGQYEPGKAPQAATHPDRQAILGTLAKATRLIGSSHTRHGPLTPSDAAQMREHIAALGAAVGNSQGY